MSHVLFIGIFVVERIGEERCGRNVGQFVVASGYDESGITW